MHTPLDERTSSPTPGMAFNYARDYQARDDGEWKQNPAQQPCMNFLRPGPGSFPSFCSARVVRCEVVYPACDLGCFLAVFEVLVAAVVEFCIDGAVALAAVTLGGCWGPLVQATSYCDFSL